MGHQVRTFRVFREKYTFCYFSRGIFGMRRFFRRFVGTNSDRKLCEKFLIIVDFGTYKIPPFRDGCPRRLALKKTPHIRQKSAQFPLPPHFLSRVGLVSFGKSTLFRPGTRLRETASRDPSRLRETASRYFLGGPFSLPTPVQNTAF